MKLTSMGNSVEFIDLSSCSGVLIPIVIHKDINYSVISLKLLDIYIPYSKYYRDVELNYFLCI